MKTPLLAIGIDSLPLPMLDAWIAEGALPNLAALTRRSARVPIRNITEYSSEGPWTTFLTGRLPEHVGYWTQIAYRDNPPGFADVGAYDYSGSPPFFALGDKYKVIVFDLPHVPPVASEVNGYQMVWGCHSPQTPRASLPPDLLAETDRRFGENPAFERDDVEPWRHEDMGRLRDALIEGARRRTDILLDLIRRDRWDLILTAFSEMHSAGHAMWHLASPDHPLYDLFAGTEATRWVLAICQAIDHNIGRLVAAVPDEKYVALFAPHGMNANNMDVPSLFFLPELLYRYSFPGKRLFRDGRGETLPPVRRVMRKSAWVTEVLTQADDPNPLRRTLRRHPSLRRRVRFLGDWLNGPNGLGYPKSWDAFAWMPAAWYQPRWSDMKAFAMPSFSNGMVRLNVAGRDRRGIVPPERYHAELDEITAMLTELIDVRNGRKIVKEVRRPRRDAFETEGVPDADLVVIWTQAPADAVESRTLGRVGPVPFRRTGGHTNSGFLFASGPGIEPEELPEAHAINLAPTFLSLMGAPVSNRFDGSALLKPREAATPQAGGPAATDAD